MSTDHFILFYFYINFMGFKKEPVNQLLITVCGYLLCVIFDRAV